MASPPSQSSFLGGQAERPLGLTTKKKCGG
jgi:hypothetical protein